MTIADMVSSTMVSVSPILIIQQEKKCRQSGGRDAKYEKYKFEECPALFAGEIRQTNALTRFTGE